jgi:hypothetical protein
MKIKTADLTGSVLDWAVAKCEGVEVTYLDDGITRCDPSGRFSPSTSWQVGGPIIERERIELVDDSPGWLARIDLWAREIVVGGPAPLIAAMRCFVASKLGEEVEIPDELLA